MKSINTDATDQQKAVIAWSIMDGMKNTALLCGDVGSGKTAIACRAILEHAKKNYKKIFKDRQLQYIIAGTSVGKIEEDIMPLLIQEYHNMGHIDEKYNGSKNIFTAFDARFRFAGINDAASIKRILGANAAGGIVDELTVFDEEIWGVIDSRMRIGDTRLIATFNPAGSSNWVREIYENDSYDAFKLFFKLDDNPALSEDATYKQRLESNLSPHMKARLLQGIWADPDGLVYPNGFSIIKNKVPYTKIIAGVDQGVENPCTAVFIGKTIYGVYHIIDEYYHPGESLLSAEEHAYNIKSKGDNLGCSLYVVDPSGSPLKVALEKQYKAKIKDGNNAVEEGIGYVQEFTNEGKLYIINGKAPNTLRESHLYKWDKERSLKLGRDVPKKENDHCMDALRYGIMHFKDRGPFKGKIIKTR